MDQFAAAGIDIENRDLRQREMEHLSIEGVEKPASRIALGTWAIGGWMWGGSDEKDAVKTIHTALDLGINLIDTAPVYGFGRAEEIVGKALAGSRRANAIIATKAGLEWRNGEILRNSSPQRLRAELEASLRRLDTEVIDLYQVHWPDESVAIEDTAAALAGFQREGKIRAIGVSNFTPAEMDLFGTGARLSAVQPPYNLFEREIERHILPYAKEKGLAVLAYGALCRGLLTGKITEQTTYEGDDLRKSDPKFNPPRLKSYLEAVRRLDDFAKERYGKTVLALAVRWILDAGPTIALWGARRPAQLDPVNEAFGWSLDAEAKHAIDRILAQTVTDPVGPEFMAPPTTAA
jgi:aryl-alcohol dehydrogenase-like predicted oxidoreductase